MNILHIGIFSRKISICNYITVEGNLPIITMNWIFCSTTSKPKQFLKGDGSCRLYLSTLPFHSEPISTDAVLLADLGLQLISSEVHIETKRLCTSNQQEESTNNCNMAVFMECNWIRKTSKQINDAGLLLSVF